MRYNLSRRLLSRERRAVCATRNIKGNGSRGFGGWQRQLDGEYLTQYRFNRDKRVRAVLGSNLWRKLAAPRYICFRRRGEFVLRKEERDAPSEKRDSS